MFGNFISSDLNDPEFSIAIIELIIINGILIILLKKE